VLTTCQPSTVWCSRESLPAAAAQPAQVRQSCSATDYYLLLLTISKQIQIAVKPPVLRLRFAVWNKLLCNNRKYYLSCSVRPRWSSGYRACYWTQGTRVQTRPRSDGFLRTIGIRSTTTFRGKEKPSASCRKVLRQVKDPHSMKDIVVGKIHETFLSQFSLLLY
jgi:hypothetical protein